MPEPGAKLYCTQRDLELIKLECQANDVPTEEIMLLWTPAEARLYFKDCIRPPDELVAARNADEKAPPRRGLAPNEFEMIICICCCCGIGPDKLFVAWLEDRKKKRSQRDAEIELQSPAATSMTRT